MDLTEAMTPIRIVFHLLLNCAFVYSGKMFVEMCDMAGIEFDCDFDIVKKAINDEFFDKTDRLSSFAHRQP